MGCWEGSVVFAEEEEGVPLRIKEETKTKKDKRTENDLRLFRVE